MTTNFIQPTFGKCIAEDEYGVLYRIKLKKLVKYQDEDKLFVPDIQRNRDNDNINNMTQTCKIKTVNALINSSNAIQLYVCGNTYAIIDGQHRMEAYRNMIKLNPDNYNDTMINVHLYNKNVSDEDMYKVYLDLNRNNPDVCNNECIDNIFKHKKYNELKN